MSSSDRPSINVFVLAGASRTDSFNGQLAGAAVAELTQQGCVVDHANVSEFEMPAYDGDLEAADGVPQGARELGDRIERADGFVIASPEYNASVPGVIKNAIDWVSRLRPQPFHSKNALLISASPSMVGGNRGLWALRIPLEHLGTRVFPDMFSLAQAHKMFAADGTLTDPALTERFSATLSAFADLVESTKHYPCAKSKWIEFLGERPEPVLDRVE